MVERERARERDYYEETIAGVMAQRDRALRGRVVIRGKETPWFQNRQSFVRHYLHAYQPPTGDPEKEPTLSDWTVFINHIKTHSGKHRHQGGLVIFVLEGEGYSIVEGERLDWEPGDLILLPLKPGGVEHQHFNKNDDKPAKWIAFLNGPMWEWGATELVQVEQHPDYGRTTPRR